MTDPSRDQLTERQSSVPARVWTTDARDIDRAVYAAIAHTPTPTLDRGMSALSRAANYSRLWWTSAAALALFGGRNGRRAAAEGLASVTVTSAAVNLVVKRVGHRQRPDRVRQGVPIARRVRMPTSLSFPSGHSAAAFAFATGVGNRLPLVGIPLHALASVVAYSRVHTGVHHPSDVVVGSVLGTALAQLTTGVLKHYRQHDRPERSRL